MPELTSAQQKAALAALPFARLRDLADDLGLEVADRRLLASFIQALADGRRVEFSEVLAQLERDELEAMCSASIRAAGRSSGSLTGFCVATRLWAANCITRCRP